MAKKKGRSLANGEQTIIPDLAPKRIDKIHKAAKRYAVARDKRMACNADEKEAHSFLLDTMTELGLDHYEYGDVSVFVDRQTKCKVKIGTPGENGDEGREGAADE